MGTSVKILRKVGFKKEGTAGTYDAPDTLLPFSTFTQKQDFGMIEDDSIVGVAFADLPLQGVRMVGGSVTAFADAITTEYIAEVAFGSLAAGVLDCPATKNELTGSFVAIDEVKTYKYGLVLYYIVPHLDPQIRLDWK